MPTDHGHVSLDHVRVPDSAVLGQEGRGLQLVQHFFNENRIRQAASSLGAAQFCIDRSVEYAKARKPFGKPLASNQAIQFPLVELQTQGEMLRALIHKTAWSMDTLSEAENAPCVSISQAVLWISARSISHWVCSSTSGNWIAWLAASGLPNGLRSSA